MLTFICYPKCTTCKKAQAWLDSQGIEYTLRNIKEENPTIDELKTWHSLSAEPLKKFFNTSGLQYRALELKDKLPLMSDEEKFNILASDGMLVKRPLLVSEDFVLIGFKEPQWQETLKTK